MLKRLKLDFRRNKMVYLMFLPVFAFFLVFHYFPIYGVQIAFRDFTPAKGILGSPWVGLKQFERFFASPYAWRVIRNTLIIGALNLLVCFPAPILLAIMLNEVRCKAFKKTVQTITYMPYFISLVVVCGLIKDFLSYDGLLNQITGAFGASARSYLSEAGSFRAIYVISNLWQSVGWDSIIYLAALSGINAELYEAADLDGAGKFSKIWHVTLPGITPTIVIMLILNMGSLMSVGYEKIILLYSPMTYETADVISTFVYRAGLKDSDYSYSTAVGLFSSIVNLLFLLTANTISRKLGDTGLW